MNEIKIPKIIYKYRTWNNLFHKKVLTENQLYTPTPKELNDPFDCKISYDYSLLEGEENTAAFVDHAINRFGTKLVERGYDIEELRKKYNQRLLKDLMGEQKLYDDFRDQKRDVHQGVISFSECWDNILMWSHYSEDHKGFCVGFDTEKLIQMKYYHNGGYVQYTNTYPQVSPLDDEMYKNLHYMLFHKSSDWSYELEYRLTKLFGIHSDPVEFHKQKLLTFENEIVSEVILGLKISAENKKQIVKICLEKRISVFQIERVPYMFKLKKVKLL